MENFYILVEDPNLKTGISEFLKLHLNPHCEIIESLDGDLIEKTVNKYNNKKITLCLFGATIYSINDVKADKLIIVSPVLNINLYENEIKKLNNKKFNINQKALILNGLENKFCEPIDLSNIMIMDEIEYLGLEDMDYYIEDIYNREFILEEIKK